MTEKFDVIVIGAGQAGPRAGGTVRQGGPQDGAGRAPSFWRHLRQQRLRSDQDHDCLRYSADFSTGYGLPYFWFW